MYKKDFILRMVEMIAELVAGILGLIKKGDFQTAQKNIDQAFYNYLQQDAGFFSSLPTQELTTTLLEEHNYSEGHLEILSELIYAQAELTKAQNHSESLDWFEKALIIKEFLQTHSGAFSFEREARIELIQQRINELLPSV